MISRTANGAAVSRVAHAVEELQKLAAAASPGDRLGSRSELVERLGVAAGTLSQAIKLLQEGGSLQLRPGPGGGIFVASPDSLQQLSSDALTITRGAALRRDALRVRAALDPLVIQDVMAHITGGQVQEIRGILSQMHSAAERLDHVEFSALSWQFQLALADVSEYEFLRAVFRTAVQLVRESKPVIFGPEVDLQERLDEHGRLLEAILAKDTASAQTVIEKAMSDMS
jgi:DNA-binding FadR family transcriptional regulator